MIKKCKHCGSRYRHGSGPGDFCCAGCEHVYRLIQVGGLDEYYKQQDGGGQPVGDQPFAAPDFVLISQLQKQAENAAEDQLEPRHLQLCISGMSCMGCAWLVEQLCHRHAGVRRARVTLGSNHLALEWQPGRCDLCALAGDLQRFGYRIAGDAATVGAVASPQIMRLGLTLVFSLNGLLLALAAATGAGGAGLRQLYDLLIAVCLFFSLFIGGAAFLKPGWGALRLRCWHRDVWPALLVMLLFGFALGARLLAGPWLAAASLFFVLLPTMLLARWLSGMLAGK